MTRPISRGDLRRQGEETLQRLFDTTQQQAGFANLLTEPVFGGVWSRPEPGACARAGQLGTCRRN